VRIVVLGKVGSIVAWTEDTADAFRDAGHDVLIIASRDPRLSKSMERLALSQRLGAPLAVWIARRIRRFRPDLVLSIHADTVPTEMLTAIRGMPGRPPLIGWVGDMFHEDFIHRAALYDAVAYTDTGLLRRHQQYAIPSRGAFVPHAANPGRRPGTDAVAVRVPRMAFVAGPTEYRRSIVAQVREPIAIFGPEWDRLLTAPQHAIESRRIPRPEVAEIYARHLAVLNVKHEGHVIDGLNQRSFAPYVHATPVVTDDQPDLPLCLEPGVETFVYGSLAELNEIYERLQREPGLAAKVGQRGQRRVLAEHTYGHRLETFRTLV